MKKDSTVNIHLHMSHTHIIQLLPPLPLLLNRTDVSFLPPPHCFLRAATITPPPSAASIMITLPGPSSAGSFLFTRRDFFLPRVRRRRFVRVPVVTTRHNGAVDLLK